MKKKAQCVSMKKEGIMSTRIIKPLAELNLMDDFLFGAAMEDLTFCKKVLEIIFGKKIAKVAFSKTQKEKRNIPGFRGIRVDVYLEDEDRIIYDVEVQARNEGNLPKRSRFYQSLLDTPLLKSGEIDFEHLNNSFIIIIAPFDLFGKGKYRYTFEYRCTEDTDIRLGDGTVKMFLNSHGTNEEEVSKELVHFLHYVESTTDRCVEEVNDSLISELHKAVRNIKASEEIGVAYMQTWEREAMLIREGKAEGKAEYVIELLEECGEVPPSLQELIMSEKDLSILQVWLKLASKVETVDEFQHRMNNADI